MNEEQRQERIPLYFLKIGEGGIFESPAHVSTVLGSCVAVTLFVPRYRIGATFHALLPKYRESNKGRNSSVFSYVDSAIDYIAGKLFMRGIKPLEIEAKVFGGASPLNIGDVGVGPGNFQMAFETLEQLRIPILSESVGGYCGRKLVFLPHSGDVYMKLLANQSLTQAILNSNE